MLNAGYKKEALQEYERAGKKYNEKYDETILNTTKLHESKEVAIKILKLVDVYIESLSNKPQELQRIASEIAIKRKAFEQEIEDLKIESKKGDQINRNVTGAGVVAGAGVAAFGPTAAMAIATTFGTASTGTAISTLSGAVATKAALAWLGGGALAAGGGGMAAGQALLAMAGPIGWAIGGTALIGGGIMANSKNKKIAEKAERETKKIKNEMDGLRKINEKVCAELKVINPLNEGVQCILDYMLSINHRDYRQFTCDDKDRLMQLMNAAESLSSRIGEKIA